MEDVIVLENQKLDITLAEEALDFEFNDKDEKDSTPPLGVPFQHQLSRPLKHRNLIIIEGLFDKNGLRFTINLLNDVNDIAFHFNPRLDQNYIARNSYINGEWGDEEGFAYMKNPLESGKNFQIQMFVGYDNYMVCINGYHMFEFAHRIPPNNVVRIEIFGEIELKTVLLQYSDIYPNHELIKYKKDLGYLNIPLYYKLEQEIRPGNKIEIKGRVKLLPVSFIINLQSAEEVFPHPLIPYHLNVRYSPDSYVVQNSWGFSGENWDEEMRSSLPLSLSPGKMFEINIYFYDSFIVAKAELWSLPVFKQRLSLDTGSFIFIQGDITLKSFNITSFQNKEDGLLDIVQTM